METPVPIDVKTKLYVIATLTTPRLYYREVNGIGQVNERLKNKATVVRYEQARTIMQQNAMMCMFVERVRA